MFLGEGLVNNQSICCISKQRGEAHSCISEKAYDWHFM